MFGPDRVPVSWIQSRAVAVFHRNAVTIVLRAGGLLVIWLVEQHHIILAY